jgi:hypothetical protein
MCLEQILSNGSQASVTGNSAQTFIYGQGPVYLICLLKDFEQFAEPFLAKLKKIYY